jgi:hypothetical protein
MRIAKATALGVAVLGSLLFTGTPVCAAIDHAGGTIKVLVALNVHSGGTIVITGAIGDYGRTVTANSAGKPQKNGGYELLVLNKGTILLDGTQVNAALNNANATDFSAASCSGTIIASAPAPIVRGTKAYNGITGSVSLTASFGFVGPFYTSGSKKGQCDTGANSPTPPGFFATITGSGTVSFG